MKYYCKLSFNRNFCQICLIIINFFIIQFIGAQTTISGNVFNDGNNDGIRNPTEVGYPFVKVNAYAPGALIPTSTTTTLSTPSNSVTSIS